MTGRCWARQTIVPLTVVCSLRPVRPLSFGLTELDSGGVRVPRAANGRAAGVGRPRKQDTWGRIFTGLDRALHGIERHAGQLRPVTAIRTAALRRCAEWIIARQERDGCWGGIQPPWVYSLMALHLLGYGLEHPVMQRGLAGLDRFTIWEDGPDGKHAPARGLPVAGLGHRARDDRPGRRRAARRSPGAAVGCALGARQRRSAGRATGRCSDLAWRRPAGPSNSTTTATPTSTTPPRSLLALGRVEQPDDATARDAGAAAARALDWLVGMQSSDGGWGAFDADNTSRLVTKLPFCDFGAVIDPPSADVTAHTVEALAAAGLGESKAVRRGVAWLLRNQEPDGSWFGRWGANYVYGTGAVVPALIAAGVLPGKPCIRRAVALADQPSERRRRLGRGPSLVRRSGLGWPGRVDGVADGLGAAGAAGRGRRRRAAQRGTRRRVAGGDPATGRNLGRAAVHRHRLPRRLLHQLPPVPAGVPGQRARPVPAEHAMTALTVCAPLRIEARAVRRGLRDARLSGRRDRGAR